MWCLWITSEAGEKTLEALVVAHVDDLLFAGGPQGKKSLDAIGKELGFGCLEEGDFTWCGKRICRASDGAIRLSMKEYHENLQEIILPKHRKADPSNKLDAGEARQLRALLGSLQWLVAQIRFDMSYAVSSLQGEHPPAIATVLKANAVMREFKADPNFELVFRPIDDLLASSWFQMRRLAMCRRMVLMVGSQFPRYSPRDATLRCSEM